MDVELKSVLSKEPCSNCESCPSDHCLNPCTFAELRTLYRQFLGVLKISFSPENKFCWCPLHFQHYSRKLFCKPNMLAAIPSHL